VLTKNPNEIYYRINAAKKLAANLGQGADYSNSLSGIEAGLASYLLWSSLDHLMCWAAAKSNKCHLDKSIYSKISFSNVDPRSQSSQISKWFNEPYLSRILNISILANKRNNYKWLKSLANQDKHKYTCVFQDSKALISTHKNLIDSANFIECSVKKLEDGTPLPPESPSTEKDFKKMHSWPDIEVLDVLICERIEFARKSIRKLEAFVYEHLNTRLDSARIEKEVDSNGKLRHKIYAKDTPIPIRWSVLAGLITHLLRSVLDHMVSALVVCNGGEPISKNKFPIFKSSCFSKNIDRIQKDLLHNLADSNKQKVLAIFSPRDHFMGNIYYNLLLLDSLRKIDTHRHMPIVISTPNYMKQEWSNKANEAAQRRKPIPDPRPEIVCVGGQNLADNLTPCGGNIVELFNDFLTTINWIAEYLGFNVSSSGDFFELTARSHKFRK